MTKDEVLALADKTGLFDYLDLEGDSVGQLILQNFAALVAAQTREQCAKVCEDIDAEYEGESVLATWCAAAIRSRHE